MKSQLSAKNFCGPTQQRRLVLKQEHPGNSKEP